MWRGYRIQGNEVNKGWGQVVNLGFPAAKSKLFASQHDVCPAPTERENFLQ